MASADIRGIYNFRKVDDRLFTSGQPLESHLAACAAEGFKVVINLGLHEDHRYALKDERATVESAGMLYVHIPVQFASPTEGDLLAFFDSMDAHRTVKTLVHCAANKRVSAFLGLYRVIRDGLPKDEAFALLQSVWEPDETWRTFIESMLEKHRAR